MLKAEELDQVQAWHDNIGSGEYLPRETMQRVIDQAREALRLSLDMDAILEGSQEWEESFHQAKALEKAAIARWQRAEKERDHLAAEVARLREVLKEADKYLTRDDGVANYIGTGSILHRQFRAALAPEDSHD